MKGKEFDGKYEPEDFAEYCFRFDCGDEGSLIWEESMHSAYEALREYVETTIAELPYEAFVFGCETRFGIGEAFFRTLFGLDSATVLSSDVFSGLSTEPLKVKELIENTKMFDTAISSDGNAFFDFLCDMTNGEERKPLLCAYFDKERLLRREHRRISP